MAATLYLLMVYFDDGGEATLSIHTDLETAKDAGLSEWQRLREDKSIFGKVIVELLEVTPDKRIDGSNKRHRLIGQWL